MTALTFKNRNSCNEFSFLNCRIKGEKRFPQNHFRNRYIAPAKAHKYRIFLNRRQIKTSVYKVTSLKVMLFILQQNFNYILPFTCFAQWIAVIIGRCFEGYKKLFQNTV